MNDKVKQELRDLIDMFKVGEIPTAISLTCLPFQELPCANWSLLNRLMCLVSGTYDARGFKQWRSVGRWVKKGCHAVYILAPRFKKEKETENDEEDTKLVGFMAVKVFRYEDTDGEPLPEMKPQELPALYDVAEKWNLKVRYPGTFFPSVLGCFKGNEIMLASHDELVFVHELSHAAHYRVRSNVKDEPKWKREVVAELSAAVLLRLYGKKSNDGHSYMYIEKYAQEAKLDVCKACMSVIADVDAVLKEIVETAELDGGSVQSEKASVVV